LSPWRALHLDIGKELRMARVSLAKNMRERRIRPKQEPTHSGPFVTISRQYGSWGFSLGLLLLDILNEETRPPNAWNIYNKEILERLARQTNLAADLLQRQRMARPKVLVDLFRSLSGEKVPSGYEIRNRITTIIRGLAVEGHALIIGQGGAGATADLPNGISVRLEAPEDWRIRRIAFREGISESKAKVQMHAIEEQREYLRRIYEIRFPRKPAFHLTYDCSAFTLAQIAQHIVYAMKLKGCI
jgi:hypothetical protein